MTVLLDRVQSLPDEGTDLIELLTVIELPLFVHLLLHDLLLRLHRLLPNLVHVSDLSLLEGIEISPNRRILLVLGDEVASINDLRLEFGLMLLHSLNELPSLLFVVDHVLDLEFEAVLMLTRVPGSRL